MNQPRWLVREQSGLKGELMRRQLLGLMMVLVCSACEALPPLPSESGERVPTQVMFTGLTLAEGTPGAGDAVANDAILAGTAVQAGVTVLDQASTPLAGALVQFGLRAEGWRTVFELPQGASCVTNEDGACAIVLSNAGRADAVTLEIRVPRGCTANRAAGGPARCIERS